MCCGWGGWMGGWGGLGMFGWFLGFLFTLGVLFLFVIGLVWAVRQVTKPQGGGNNYGTLPDRTPSNGQRTCPTCGRPMAADWNICPYDGTPLT